jgi:hypothetical protein
MRVIPQQACFRKENQPFDFLASSTVSALNVCRVTYYINVSPCVSFDKPFDLLWNCNLNTVIFQSCIKFLLLRCTSYNDYCNCTYL